MDEYRKEIEEGIKAVYKASLFVRDVQRVLLEEEVISKDDKSPVTIADFGSQALLVHHLTQSFDYPFISEEDSDDLKANPNLTQRLLSALSSYLSSSPSQLFSLIDEGSSKEKREGRKWWTIDPIDGTMGFLRKGQYAVALSLLCDNEPVVGILGCPSLPLSLSIPNSPLGCIFFAVKGGGSYQFYLDDAIDGDVHKAQRIFVSPPPLLPRSGDDNNNDNDNHSLIDVSKLTLIESFESSHSSHSLTSLISDHLGAKGEGIKMDSQVKYAVVARGEASYYLRLSSLSYREKIWDHAAGSLIVIEAGGLVTDYSSLPLNFSFGKHLSHNQGLIVTSKELYPLVKAAVDAVDPISILKQQQNQH